jgi:hypothetical protein
MQPKRPGQFAWKVCAAIFVPILTIALTIILGVHLSDDRSDHYYQIERLNLDGKVQQVYFSKGRFPWAGEHEVSFRSYPSGNFIHISANYTVEDIGTNAPETL